MSEQATAATGAFRDTRTLSEKLAARRENWKPVADESHPRVVEGLVIDKDERDLGYNQQGTAPFIRVLADDGAEWSVAGFHAVLRAEIMRAGPNIGDRIGVVYQGEGKAKDGLNERGEPYSPPHLYRVVVERNPDGPQTPDADLPPAPDFEPDADFPF